MNKLEKFYLNDAVKQKINKAQDEAQDKAKDDIFRLENLNNTEMKKIAAR